MFDFYRNKTFFPKRECFYRYAHPMASIEFMRQDVSLPFKKGKKMVQRLKNNQAYVREIIYLPKERICYGTN